MAMYQTLVYVVVTPLVVNDAAVPVPVSGAPSSANGVPPLPATPHGAPTPSSVMQPAGAGGAPINSSEQQNAKTMRRIMAVMV
jgi:hypothetical protein